MAFSAQFNGKDRYYFEYYEQEPANSMITKLLLKYSILHKNRQLNPDGLTIDELLDRMYVTLFEEKGRSGELSRYDRALQKGFVQDLVVNGENPTTLFNGLEFVSSNWFRK